MYILFSDLLSYKGKLGEENFKWQATIQKDEREEEKSIEGGESIYSYRSSGVLTQEFGILFIIYQFLKNRVYMNGLFTSLFLVYTFAGDPNNYVMGYINSYFTEPTMSEWRLLKNKILFYIIVL